MEKQWKILFLKVPILFFLMQLFTYCVKDNTQINGSGTQGIVEISFSATSFEMGEQLGQRRATPDLVEYPLKSDVQIATVDLGNDLLMIAELAPETTNTTPFKNGSKAEVIVLPLEPNIRYRVVVFDVATELYVTERDYTRGSEDTVAPLLLDGGKQYTFIVYSINSATLALPIITPVNIAQRTLANTTITMNGEQEFMYFRQNLRVTGGGVTDRLDITLRHQLTQITAIIDSRQTGFNISTVVSNFGPHFPQLTANLGTGNISRVGVVATAPVVFSELGTQLVTSTPTIINANANNTTRFSIASLQIGAVTQTNLTPFTALAITPGLRYNMVLRLVPTDQNLTLHGFQAVRINGDIWAANNLGAINAIFPNPLNLVEGDHGNYYQWGRLLPAALPISTTVIPGGWLPNNSPPANVWNGGTITAPSRGFLDPCPVGYRVPVAAEYNRLLAGTTQSNVGNFNNSPVNFTAGKQFTSTRNSTVSLVFPVQGWYNFTTFLNINSPTTIQLRGQEGWYWTSDRPNGLQVSLFSVSQNPSAVTNRAVNDNGNMIIAHNLRCVGIQ